MLRVRIDGGQLSTEQLRAIGEISHDVRPRHRRHHRPAEHPAPLDPGRGRARRSGSGWRRSACRHHRGVRRLAPRRSSAPRSPASPRTRSSTAPRRSTRSSARYIGDPEYSNLPRKFKTVDLGHPSQDVAHEVNDVVVRRRRRTPSTAPASTCGSAAACPPTRCSAQRLGVWVPLDEVADVWDGVIAIFRDYGYRRLRTRARLKFLVADWGVREVPRGPRERVPRADAGRRRPPPAPERAGDHIGVHRQQDGRFYVGVAPTVGRVDGTVLDQARRHRRGSTARDRVRTTPYQKLLVLDVDADQVDSLVAALDGDRALGPAVATGGASTMACTGIEFCKLAIVETKQRGRRPDRRAGAARSPTSTRRSPSTSTAARTPAPAPRSPTSASRAAGPGRRRRAGRGLPGAPRRRARPGRRRSAASCARLKVTSAGLADYVERGHARSWSSAPRTRPSPPGSSAPTTRPCAARSATASWSRSDERAGAAPFHCPYCGDEDLRPSEEGHGAWECHACLRAFTLKILGHARPARPLSDPLDQEVPR